MFKKESKARYRSMRDIAEGIRASQECHVREKTFDWRDIAVKGFINKHKIIRACKFYGKVQRVRYGFIVKFN